MNAKKKLKTTLMPSIIVTIIYKNNPKLQRKKKNNLNQARATILFGAGNNCIKQTQTTPVASPFSVSFKNISNH